MKLAIEIILWCVAISFVIGSLVPLVMFAIVGVQWLVWCATGHRWQDDLNKRPRQGRRYVPKIPK